MGVWRLLDTHSLFAKQMISAYQQEQDNAEGKNAVPDEKHQKHSDGNPKHNKTYETFHGLLLRCVYY